MTIGSISEELRHAREREENWRAGFHDGQRELSLAEGSLRKCAVLETSYRRMEQRLDVFAH